MRVFHNDIFTGLYGREAFQALQKVFELIEDDYEKIKDKLDDIECRDHEFNPKYDRQLWEKYSHLKYNHPARFLREGTYILTGSSICYDKTGELLFACHKKDSDDCIDQDSMAKESMKLIFDRVFEIEFKSLCRQAKENGHMNEEEMKFINETLPMLKKALLNGGTKWNVPLDPLKQTAFAALYDSWEQKLGEDGISFEDIDSISRKMMEMI